MTRAKTVLLGVSGSIAAYKAAEICSALVQRDVAVHAILTAHACRLVGPATFQALTGNPVVTEMFHQAAPGSGMAHIDLADRADLLLVAPATANILAKLAWGLADDALSTTALSCAAPLVIAPAMNVRMWNHAAVQANVKVLQARQATFIGPEEGQLACGTRGRGRMAAPSVIVEQVMKRLDSAT